MTRVFVDMQIIYRQSCTSGTVLVRARLCGSICGCVSVASIPRYARSRLSLSLAQLEHTRTQNGHYFAWKAQVPLTSQIILIVLQHTRVTFRFSHNCRSPTVYLLVKSLCIIGSLNSLSSLLSFSKRFVFVKKNSSKLIVDKITI